jgi:hypothetical protein
VLVVGLLGTLAACGGSTPSAFPSASAGSAQATATATGAAPGSVGDTGLVGNSVTITMPDGYKFGLSASPVHSAPTVHINGSTHTAPPGNTYLTVDVQVQNPLTDRLEPLGELVTPYYGYQTAFSLAVPNSDLTAFSLSGTNCNVHPGPATTCLIGASLSLPDNSSLAPTEIDTAARMYMQIVWYSMVPESAPFKDVTLYVWNGLTEVLVPPH